MIGRIIRGIFVGIFLRLIFGVLFVFVGGYYLLFHKLPFTNLPGLIWNQAKDSTVHVSVEQNGQTVNFDFFLNDQTKAAIDKWLADNNLNKYGDPKSTVYSGGTPSFNEQTGQIKDSYAAAIEKHPELKQIIEKYAE